MPAEGQSPAPQNETTCHSSYSSMDFTSLQSNAASCVMPDLTRFKVGGTSSARMVVANNLAEDVLAA